MIPQLGMVKIIGGASLFAFAVAKISPYVGEVINEASGVSLGIVGAVFTVAVTAVVWSVRRDSEIRNNQREQNRCLKELSNTVNELIDLDHIKRIQLYKIGDKLGIPGSKENLENLRAIEHVRPPSTL